MRLIASAVTVLGLGISAAQSAESCEGSYGFEEEGYAAAKVKSKRSYFLADDGAPLKPYVVRGDEVVVTGRKEGMICAVYYSGKGNETSGWLKSDDFDISEKPELKPRDWVGKWSKGEWGDLELSPGKNDWLSVSGDALWAANAEAMQNGGVNVGEVAGNAPVENGILGFTMTEDETYLPFSGARELDCAIRLRRVGENYLLVEDNNNCGGHNVSFTGLYARAN